MRKFNSLTPKPLTPRSASAVDEVSVLRCICRVTDLAHTGTDTSFWQQLLAKIKQENTPRLAWSMTGWASTSCEHTDEYTNTSLHNYILALASLHTRLETSKGRPRHSSQNKHTSYTCLALTLAALLASTGRANQERLSAPLSLTLHRRRKQSQPENV